MKTASLCVAALALLVGCSDWFTPQSAKSARLVFSFAPAASRTIVPDLRSVDSYLVTLTSNDGYATVGPLDSASLPSVYVGNWDIFVSAQRSGTEVGTGTLAGYDLVQGSNSIQIPIAFTSPTGSGDLSFTVSFNASTGIDTVTGEIWAWNGTTDVDLGPATVTLDTTTDPAVPTATFSATGLPTGYGSDLVMTFKRGSKIAGIYRESINVRGGVPSNAWIGIDPDTLLPAILPVMPFKDTDFFDSNASLSNLAFSSGSIILNNYDFSSATTTYYGRVLALDSPSFTLTRSVDGQSMDYVLTDSDSTVIDSGTAASGVSVPLAWTTDSATLEITVTAPDRQTTKVYTVELIKLGAADIHISLADPLQPSVTVSAGASDPLLGPTTNPTIRMGQSLPASITDLGGCTVGVWLIDGANSGAVRYIDADPTNIEIDSVYPNAAPTSSLGLGSHQVSLTYQDAGGKNHSRYLFSFDIVGPSFLVNLADPSQPLVNFFGDKPVLNRSNLEEMTVTVAAAGCIDFQWLIDGLVPEVSLTSHSISGDFVTISSAALGLGTHTISLIYWDSANQPYSKNLFSFTVVLDEGL